MSEAAYNAVYNLYSKYRKEEKDMDFVKVKIEWQEYIIHEAHLPQLVDVLRKIKKLDGHETKSVAFEVSEAPDLAKEKLKKEVREEVRETLQKDLDEKTKWWLATIRERDAARKQVADLEKKLSAVEDAITPPQGDTREDS